MAKIIINADDFGMNPFVTASIEKALKDDRITSTTILANTTIPEEVVRVYNELKSQKSFGAHLNLTEGKCLTESVAFHRIGLVDDDNCFSLSPRTIEWTPELLKDVYTEWDTQIRRIKDMGITISHIDGHHHIHNDSVFQSIVFQLCHNEGIKRIRHIFYRPISWRINAIMNRTSEKFRDNNGSKCEQNNTQVIQPVNSGDDSHVNHLLVLYKQLMWKRRVKHEGIMITDYFGSYKSFYENLVKGNTLRKNDIVELMCHPGSELTTEEMKLIYAKAIEPYISNVVYLNYNQL